MPIRPTRSGVGGPCDRCASATRRCRAAPIAATLAGNHDGAWSSCRPTLAGGNARREAVTVAEARRRASQGNVDAESRGSTSSRSGPTARPDGRRPPVALAIYNALARPILTGALLPMSRAVARVALSVCRWRSRDRGRAPRRGRAAARCARRHEQLRARARLAGAARRAAGHGDAALVDQQDLSRHRARLLGVRARAVRRRRRPPA